MQTHLIPLSLLLTATTRASAFVAVPANRRVFVTSLQGTSRPDASGAVQEAMEASEKYGPTSKEARVAWDIVEELNASDNSPAIDKVVKMTPEEVSRLDYYNQVHFLAALLQDTKEKIAQMKSLTTSLRDLELKDPSLAYLEGNEDLKRALAEAKAAVEVHGAGSQQAMKAWNALEACAGEDECSVDSTYRYSAASLKAHHYYNAVMDTSLLSEAMDGFDTIQGLNKYVDVEKSRLDKMVEEEGNWWMEKFG